MEKKAFEKLLKKETPKRIIYLYICDKIYLTSKQLDKVIALKNK